MTEAAEEDLLLPYSLMLDALDRCDAGDGFPPAFRTAFLANLSDALDAYQAELAADPSGNTYWKHDRVVRVTDMGPEDAAAELESRAPIPAPPAGDDGEHW